MIRMKRESEMCTISHVHDANEVNRFSGEVESIRSQNRFFALFSACHSEGYSIQYSARIDWNYLYAPCGEKDEISSVSNASEINLIEIPQCVLHGFQKAKVEKGRRFSNLVRSSIIIQLIGQSRGKTKTINKKKMTCSTMKSREFRNLRIVSSACQFFSSHSRKFLFFYFSIFIVEVAHCVMPILLLHLYS